MFGIPSYGLPWKRPLAILNMYRYRLAIRNKNRVPKVSFMPISAYIEPTVACDIDCTFCHSSELRDSRKKISLSMNDFEHILNEIPTLLNITLVGMGEPTLNRNLFQMIRLAKKRGIAVRTYTNCNRITPRIIKELLSCGAWFIGTSIDGATAKSYERGRRGGDFKRTVNNLKELVQARGSSPYPTISVEMLALEYNYTEMPGWVKMCADIGVDELIIKKRIGSWGKKSWIEKTIAVSGSENHSDFDIYIEESKAIAKEHGIRLEEIGALYNTENRCPRPWGGQIYVSTTGDIVPCCAIADPQVISMGNIFTQRFIDIWNNDTYMKLRKNLGAGNIPDFCLNCYDPRLVLERSRVKTVKN